MLVLVLFCVTVPTTKLFNRSHTNFFFRWRIVLSVPLEHRASIKSTSDTHDGIYFALVRTHGVAQTNKDWTPPILLIDERVFDSILHYSTMCEEATSRATILSVPSCTYNWNWAPGLFRIELSWAELRCWAEQLLSGAERKLWLYFR